eukprot:g46963.t1
MRIPHLTTPPLPPAFAQILSAPFLPEKGARQEKKPTERLQRGREEIRSAGRRHSTEQGGAPLPTTTAEEPRSSSTASSSVGRGRFRFLFSTTPARSAAVEPLLSQTQADEAEADDGEVAEPDLTAWRTAELLVHGAASFETNLRSVVSMYVEWLCAARGLRTDDAMLASQLSLCFVVGRWGWSEIRLRLCEVLAQDTDEPLVPVEWTQIPANVQWEHDARPRRALISRLAEFVEAELAWDSGRVSKQGSARAFVELLLRWHVQNEVVRRHGHEHGTHSHHRLFATVSARLPAEVANVAPEAWGPVLSAALPATLAPGEHCYAAPGTKVSSIAAALDEAKHARTLRLDPLVPVHLFFYLAWPALLNHHLGAGRGLQLRTAMRPAADQELLTRIFLHRVLAALRGGRSLQVFAAIDAALKEWQQMWGQRPAALVELCSNIRMPLVYFVEGHTWKTIVRDTLAYMLGESSIVNGLWPTDWPCARCLRRRAVTWGIPLYHYCHVCVRNERSHLVADLEAIRKSFVLNILQVDLELLDVIRSWWDVSYPQEFLQVIQTMDLAFTYKGTGWKRILFAPIQQGLLVWGLFQTNLAPHVRQNQDRITAERYQMSEKHFQLLQDNLQKTEAFLNQAREASVLGNEEMVPCGLQLQHMLPTGGFLAGP